MSFDETGKFSTVGMDIFTNQGHAANESSNEIAVMKASGPYYADTWNVNGKDILTDRGSSSAARAPGNVEDGTKMIILNSVLFAFSWMIYIPGSVNATSIIETIVEHVAEELNKDPLEIRELNFTTETKRNKNIGPQSENLAATSIVPILKEQAMYKTRRAQVEQFNKVKLVLFVHS